MKFSGRDMSSSSPCSAVCVPQCRGILNKIPVSCPLNHSVTGVVTGMGMDCFMAADSSSIEAGVLMAITGHGQTPPEVGTGGVTRHPPLLYLQPGARPGLLIWQLLIHVLVVPQIEVSL
ncbi:hypothetical protein AVEN_108573-1 [Araneus ventricosus]|uniref:Uncharacterized protein n=1 Tax=Araneus ventricosus TaxID=182803 RepID=A0A4Y2DJE6_ARAVE|nr:hypothetical protein AVEN_108573-1 [Araneus ventricosus]